MPQLALFAHIGNDVALTRSALYADAGYLRVDAAGPAPAWGVGSVQDSRALVRRRPVGRAEQTFDFAALASDTPSRCALAVHLSEATGLPTDALPPFRYRNWLVARAPMAKGQIPSDVRQALVSAAPDHVRRSADGKSDGEVLAQAVFTELAKRHSNVKSPAYPADWVVGALWTACEQLEAALPDVSHEMIVTNARCCVAVAKHRSLHYKHFDGLDDDPAENDRRAEMSLPPRKSARPHYSGLTITSAEVDDTWTELPAQHVLRFELGGSPAVLPVGAA